MALPPRSTPPRSHVAATDLPADLIFQPPTSPAARSQGRSVTRLWKAGDRPEPDRASGNPPGADLGAEGTDPGGFLVSPAQVKEPDDLGDRDGREVPAPVARLVLPVGAEVEEFESQAVEPPDPRRPSRRRWEAAPRELLVTSTSMTRSGGGSAVRVELAAFPTVLGQAFSRRPWGWSGSVPRSRSRRQRVVVARP